MVKGAHLCFLVTILCACAVVSRFPGALGLEDNINKYVYNNNGFGAYSFEMETSDGTYRREDGRVSDESGEMVVRGEYGYIDPTGRHHSVRYIADANGFQPLADDDTSEDVELRRIFPSEFPQDTIRRSGAADPEHLGRYGELKHYFKNPKENINSHFEELACYERNSKKVCAIDLDRYSPEEEKFYSSRTLVSHVDRRRVFCLMLLCFTEDELDRVVASF